MHKIYCDKCGKELNKKEELQTPHIEIGKYAIWKHNSNKTKIKGEYKSYTLCYNCYNKTKKKIKKFIKG